MSRSNDPVPVGTRLQLVLAVLARDMTVAEAARRHGVSAASINRWRHRFVDAGKAAMEDAMPGKAGSRGSLVERRQRGDPGAEVERSQCDRAQLEAAGGVSAWVVSSYDGDLVLVPTDRLDGTSEVLQAAGHQVRR